MRGKVLFSAAMAALTTVWGVGFAHADPVTKWKGAPETDEEDRTFKVNGRVMYDVFNINDDGALGTTNVTRTATRRAFLGAEGRLTQNWRYNIKFDINPDSSGGGTVKADDFYIEYAGSDYSIFIGQNNAISQMENRDSSLTIPFNERSGIANAFAPNDKQMGLAYLTNGGNWSAGFGVYGDQLQTKADSAATVNEAAEERARVTWAPIYEKTPSGTTLLHLGLYARHRDSAGDSFFSYKAIPNTNFAPGANNITTPAFAASDNYFDGEFAAQFNAFGVDGEYGQLKAKHGAGLPASVGDPTFKGGYFGFYWSPTGESRSYNAADGSFKNIVPLRTLGSDGGIGHIMLSARYDVLDMTNAGVDGGKQTSYVGGVTWVPIDHIKMQFNYSQNNIDLSNSTAGSFTNTSGKANVAEMRTQIDW